MPLTGLSRTLVWTCPDLDEPGFSQAAGGVKVIFYGGGAQPYFINLIASRIDIIYR